jgi:hypothetical protein
VHEVAQASIRGPKMRKQTINVKDKDRRPPQLMFWSFENDDNTIGLFRLSTLFHSHKQKCRRDPACALLLRSSLRGLD